MSAFDDFEREYLEANPHARSPSYVPPAPTPAPAPEPELSAADLAEAAALALDPHGDPNMRRVVWEARVRAAEREMAEAGPVAEAPCGQSVSAAVQPDEKAWAMLSDLAKTVSPLTGRRYADDLGAEGQRVREALFAARTCVMRGESIDATMLAQVRAGIAADQAEAARLKAKTDAEELARFRERLP